MFLREIISSADFSRLINELNAAQNPVALFGLPKTAQGGLYTGLGTGYRQKNNCSHQR